MIAHSPAPVMRTTAPLIVQLPLAVNDTGRPDEAVAVTWKSASPAVLSVIEPNVIVWSSSLGQAGAAFPSAEHGAESAGPRFAHSAAERLVASSSAAPASSFPQPIVGVQPCRGLRRADCLMMSATW